MCCGYSKEPSQVDSSFEHPKHVKTDGKRIYLQFSLKFSVYLNPMDLYRDCPVSDTYHHFNAFEAIIVIKFL